MTTTDFAEKFKEIREMGYVPSLRNGPTGIGFTLETLLGIHENSDAFPDIEGAELKAHRANHANLITLFTYDKKAWKMPPLEAVKEFGSFDENDRLGLYYTMLLRPNNAGLYLHLEKDNISVRHVSGTIVAEWPLEALANRFAQKMPSLIFVTASAEFRGDKEYFHFQRAQLMKGTSPELLHDQFQSGNISVDLRLHDKGTMARNHGTGFRAYEDNLPHLFRRVQDL